MLSILCSATLLSFPSISTPLAYTIPLSVTLNFPLYFNHPVSVPLSYITRYSLLTKALL